VKAKEKLYIISVLHLVGLQLINWQGGVVSNNNSKWLPWLLSFSHVVRRSKALVWHAARKKKNIPKSEQYCMFFNRFGKLNLFYTSCDSVLFR